jgi:hypothetical protein
MTTTVVTTTTTMIPTFVQLARNLGDLKVLLENEIWAAAQ